MSASYRSSVSCLAALGHALAQQGWSQAHVADLARVGEDYGLDLTSDAESDDGLLSRLRQKSGEFLGRHHEPALLLLRDLREIHLRAAAASLDWEILAQTAQALKDRELLAVTKKCHPDTLRQMRWANAALKENAAQIMVTA